MAYPLILTGRYDADVADVRFYLKVKLGSPMAARRFDKELLRAYGRIGDMPRLYAVSRQPPLSRRGIRVCPVEGYAIYYRISGGSVVLLRLLHQRQDTSRAIFG